MSLPSKKDLGTLRAKIKARLGHASGGTAGGLSNTIIDSFLQSSQYFLYWFLQPKDLISLYEIGFGKTDTLGVSNRFYQWDSTVHPDNILQMVVEDTTLTQGNIWPMKEGIDWKHDAYASPDGMPVRFARRDQMEVWPAPDRLTYIIRIEHVKRLLDFTNDTDVATIDDELLFIHALARAKAHYSQKDWEIVFNDAKSLVRILKAKNMSSERFLRRSEHDDELNALQDDQLIGRNILDV